MAWSFGAYRVRRARTTATFYSLTVRYQTSTYIVRDRKTNLYNNCPALNNFSQEYPSPCYMDENKYIDIRRKNVFSQKTKFLSFKYQFTERE